MCSASQWDAPKSAMPTAPISQHNGANFSPDNSRSHITQPTLQKLNKLGYKVLPHRPHSSDLSPTSSSISTTFAGKTFPKPGGGKKWFPRIHWILKHRFLHYRNKQTCFSLAKNILIVMVPILINKGVFEPSYNDLKFMVQNCNYIWTNLIL